VSFSVKCRITDIKGFIICFFLIAAFFTGICSSAFSAGAEDLFTSSIFFPGGKFTTGIEGPACDPQGNLYAVNYTRKGTIGLVAPDGQGSLYVELPTGSTGNGIRFDSRGYMLIADYTGHNILQVNIQTREVSVLAHESTMSQPNDIAITGNDLVFASDPNWTAKSGRVWRITPDGAVTLAASGLGTANGIEVSPDERTLYVNESSTGNVLAFDISPSGELGNKRVLINLPNTTLDGMRCDIAGNLYVSRMGTEGAIAIVSSQGTLLREVTLTGKKPSNITFGGSDGRTCYVTMADNGSIETFRSDTPGQSWKIFQDRLTVRVAENSHSPQPFALIGSFPNPFNSSTVIEYILHRDAPLELALFNMAGQRIAVLRNGPERAGRHSVSWNAGNLPSGVYFIRLKADGAAASRRITLVR
jgi:sugar lactone lactonase YvrE